MPYIFNSETKRRLYDAINNKSRVYDNKWTATLCVYIRDSGTYIRQDINVASRILRTYIEVLNEVLTKNDFYYTEKYGNHLIDCVENRGNRVCAICLVPKKRDMDYIFEIAMHIYSFHMMFQKMLKKRGLRTFKIGVGLAASDTSPGVMSLSFADAVILARNGNYGVFKTFVANSYFYRNLNDNYKKYFYHSNKYVDGAIYHCDAWFINEKKWVEENFN